MTDIAKLTRAKYQAIKLEELSNEFVTLIEKMIETRKIRKAEALDSHQEKINNVRIEVEVFLDEVSIKLENSKAENKLNIEELESSIKSLRVGLDSFLELIQFHNDQKKIRDQIVLIEHEWKNIRPLVD